MYKVAKLKKIVLIFIKKPYPELTRNNKKCRIPGKEIARLPPGHFTDAQ